MKRITLLIKVLGILLMIVVICQSCTALMTLPKADTAEHFLTGHKEELQILAEYLVKQNYSTIYIDRADGTALANLVQVKIEDDAVLKSLNTIFRDGCIDIYKDTSKNSIQFMLWKRTRDEADAGLLFAVVPNKQPEAEFQTEIEPLTEDRWYYYLAEYNKWRADQNHS